MASAIPETKCPLTNTATRHPTPRSLIQIDGTMENRIRPDLPAQRSHKLPFDCDRVTIEPFCLRQPGKYDLVIDRLTHWYSTSRE